MNVSIFQFECFYFCLCFSSFSALLIFLMLFCIMLALSCSYWLCLMVNGLCESTLTVEWTFFLINHFFNYYSIYLKCDGFYMPSVNFSGKSRRHTLGVTACKIRHTWGNAWWKRMSLFPSKLGKVWLFRGMSHSAYSEITTFQEDHAITP